MIYEEMIADDNLMQEIEEIIHYASQRFQHAISVGSEIESKLSVSPVGIIPLKLDEGYYFLSNSQKRSTIVYIGMGTKFCE